MDLFDRTSLTLRRQADISIATYHWRDTYDTHVEVYLRSSAGILFWQDFRPAAVPEPDDLTLVRAAYQYGRLCARPFHLQQSADVSAFYCTMACFVSCARAWNLSPITLMREADAYLRVTGTDLAGLRAQARWEGVVIPPTFHAQAIEALCAALADQQCRPLADVLRQHTLTRRGY